MLKTPSHIIQATMPPARPPHLAEREELDAALAIGSTDALLLFLERHPKSRYRTEALGALDRLGKPKSDR